MCFVGSNGFSLMLVFRDVRATVGQVAVKMWREIETYKKKQGNRYQCVCFCSAIIMTSKIIE